MKNLDQTAEYTERGYFVMRDCLNEPELKSLLLAVENCIADDNDPGRVNEIDGFTPRALHGTHLRNDVMEKLCRHPKLLNMAQNILNDDVYVHQFKLNVKSAFVGDVWEWHQDFSFYHREDELKETAVVTIALFVDDCTEFNGPLTVIPGSHKKGFIIAKKNSFPNVDSENPWLSNTTAKLRYTVDTEVLKDLVSKYGMEAPLGEAGDAVVFHPLLFHCSGANMSPYDRKVIFISYNSVSNKPVQTRTPRPEFLSGRNYLPLTAYNDGLRLKS